MLFYVMHRPDPFGPWVKVGRTTPHLVGACKAANRCAGRVYVTDGHETRMIDDSAWVKSQAAHVAPTPLEGRAYWAARNEAALFG